MNKKTIAISVATILYILSFLFLPTFITLILTGIYFIILISRHHIANMQNTISLTIVITLCIGIITLLLFGISRGMEPKELKHSIPHICYSIQHTPSNVSLKSTTDDYSGSIIILYRFGCEDCEKVYDNIQSWITAHPSANITWIASRSQKGQQFLAKYPVNYVPTGIYVFYNQNGTATYIQKRLNNHDTFDTSSLDRLYELQQQRR